MRQTASYFGTDEIFVERALCCYQIRTSSCPSHAPYIYPDQAAAAPMTESLVALSSTRGPLLSPYMFLHFGSFPYSLVYATDLSNLIALHLHISRSPQSPSTTVVSPSLGRTSVPLLTFQTPLVEKKKNTSAAFKTYCQIAILDSEKVSASFSVFYKPQDLTK